MGKRCFEPHVVFVMGAPGCGKGTQCRRIASEFGYTCVSLPDLLEAAVDRGTIEGRQVADLVANGALVPTALKIQVLKQALLRKPNARYLIDGFPVNMEQAMEYERMIGRPRFVLFFDCPEEVSRSRLLEPEPAPPTMEGGVAASMSVRARRDAREARAAADARLNTRFQAFLESSMPVIEKYSAEGVVRVVSAMPYPDSVFEMVKAEFQPRLVLLVGATGSGRGAIATALGKEQHYTRIRTTTLLQQESKRNTEWGQEIRDAFEQKRAVATAVPIALIKRAMARARNNRFLLDGYPRLVNDGYPGVFDQLAELEAAVGTVTHCVDLQCPRAVRAQRTKSSRRELDAATEAYRTEKLPVVHYLDQLGRVLHVDAAQPLDVVVASIRGFIAEPPPQSELFRVDAEVANAAAAAAAAAAADFDQDDDGF